jgi:alkylation response protein AidB-like acyl-CoA dehydrogenase
VLDLGLTPEQEQLRDAFRSLYDRECDTKTVRAAEPLGFSSGLWRRVRELGALDMAVPEAAGGAGATLLDAAIVSEATGAAVAPVPLVETIVAARLLATLGSEPARALLERALADDAVVTVALQPLAGDGVAHWVPAGAVADVVVALDGDRVLGGGGTPPGVAENNLAALPVAHRNLHDGAEVLAHGPGAVAAFERARTEWRILTAAALCGAGRRALDGAVAYTTERRQFDVPIASFQAVAHRLADLATAVDGAQLLTWKAAWAADEDPGQAASLALMAFSFAAEAAETAATEALHFHGGYGFMLEYDIQLYFRRIKAWVLLNGDRQHELLRLADELWGGIPAPTAG